jgi:Fe2+ or Zn2+ uptake regulation protein
MPPAPARCGAKNVQRKGGDMSYGSNAGSQTPAWMDSARLVRSAGGRVTYLRMRILDLLASSDAALCVREIEGRLSTKASQYVTIYRVLHWLVEQRIASRITGPDGTWYFHLGTTSESSGFGSFYCVGCRRLFPVEHEARVQPPNLHPGFTAISAQLSVTGYCARCEKDRGADRRRRGGAVGAPAAS